MKRITHGDEIVTIFKRMNNELMKLEFDKVDFLGANYSYVKEKAEILKGNINEIMKILNEKKRLFG